MKHKILLGPAGSPVSSSLEGVKEVKELGLQAMEVEFTYGVRMTNKLAEQVGEQAKKLGIRLTVHAPYWINLASHEKDKINQSKKRILDSCERAHHLGAWSVTFHPAFYGKHSKEDTFDMVVKQIRDMQNIIKKNRWHVRLAPETTGKHTQFGSLDELIKLVKKTKCGMCVDFAHIYARNNGSIDYAEVFDKLKKIKVEHLHTHFSGIAYTDKGERNHLNMNNHPSFKILAQELLKRKVNATIISESPVTWRDALKMKRILERIGYKF